MAIRNLSPEKQVCYLHKEKNTEDKEAQGSIYMQTWSEDSREKKGAL